MERLPLEICVGPVEEAVLYERELVAGLTEFELDASNFIKTRFTCVNCFPRRSGHGVQDHALMTKAYPLRIYVGDDVNQIRISLNGRPIGRIRNIQVKLSTTAKRVIRLTSDISLPEEAERALLDLGVEIIVQPPAIKQSTGDSDAHL